MSIVLGIFLTILMAIVASMFLGMAIGIWADALNDMPWWQRRQKRKAEEEGRKIARKLKEVPPPSSWKRNP